MRIFCSFLICLSYFSLISADGVKSSTNNLKLNINTIQTKVQINETGVGVLTTLPSANLHVNGNAIISDALSVGTTSLASNTLTAQNVTINNLLNLSVQSEHPANAQNGSMYVNSNGKIYTYIDGAWSPLYTDEMKYQRGMLKLNNSWVTVTLDESYSDMVVITTPTNVYSGASFTTRVRNATGNSFEMRLQRMDGSSAALGSDRKVYFFVIEAGIYTSEKHGIKMEAATFSSNVTDNSGSWVGERQFYQQTYTNPVVLGQVMSENDADFSMFWAKGSSVTTPPDSSNLYLGKHVGSDSDTTRADETIGYLVFESGTQRHRDLALTTGVGAATISGAEDQTSHYVISGPTFSRSGLASLATMNGADGGIAFFREFEGAPAVTATNLHLNVEEDQIGDAERNHAAEQVAWCVFEDNEIKMERGVVSTSTNGITVSLNQSYTSPIVLATMTNFSTEPLCVRVGNVMTDSFTVKANHMSTSTNLITGVNVHYLVIEEGVYDYSTYGIKMEARKLAGLTPTAGSNWTGTESNYIQSYDSPVVLGNSQTENNTAFSTFWSRAGSSELDPPSSANIRVGVTKMSSNFSYSATEDVGYLIIDADQAVIDGVKFIAAVGADTVVGTNVASVTYSIGETIDVAITTQVAMDGADGGTINYINVDPRGQTNLKLSSQEDTLGDAETGHANEQAAYLIFY